MATTIKISKKTQQELFQIKNQLERTTNQPLSYNDIVEILISKFKHVDKGKLVDDLLSIKGILSENSPEIFKEMRSTDKKREERYLSY